MAFQSVLSAAIAGALLIAGAAHADSADPLQIFVSKDQQFLTVYDGGSVVATSKVSTGKDGHTTPSGIFSVLEKQKTHFSNIYDDASMPFMQRLTWSGIALHESNSVPNYPASHGCVRMPGEFARSLYGMTQRGFHVLITDRALAPHQIGEVGLFKPRYAKPDGGLLSDASMRPALTGGEQAVEVAAADTLPKLGASAVADLPRAQAPIKLLITRVSGLANMRETQGMLNLLGYDVGPMTGYMTGKTNKAIKAYQDLHGQKVSGQLTPQLRASLHKVLNRKPITGWLFARQNFKPVFDGPVDIANPELALGTHFFNAVKINPAQNSAEWYGVTLDNQIPAWQASRVGITRFPDAQAPTAADDAFMRISIPAEMREKIETMLGNGSSVTITDIASDGETGEGTDFITTTNEPPKSG